MTAQTYIINKDTVSLIDKIDMDDPGNILIGNESMARWLLQLLHTRILNEASQKTHVHMHLPQSESFVIDSRTLSVLGANVYLWTTNLPSSIDHNLKYVVVPEDSAIAQQSFLIIDSSSYTRALFIWEREDPMRQGEHSIIGVLVTNPVLARDLCYQMDAIVDQAAQ